MRVPQAPRLNDFGQDSHAQGRNTVSSNNKILWNTLVDAGPLAVLE